MWELFWAGTEVSALEKTALVAKLGSGESTRTEYADGTEGYTYHLARGEVGTPPSGGISSTAVVALPPDAVRELCRGVVGVANQIIGRRLVVLRLVRGPEVLHGAGRDWVRSRRVGIGGRVRLGVSRPIVVWRGRLVVEPVCLRGSVSCLHYDLVWMGRRGVKVPRLLRRELRRRGERKSGGDATDGDLRGEKGETWKSDP